MVTHLSEAKRHGLNAADAMLCVAQRPHHALADLWEANAIRYAREAAHEAHATMTQDAALTDYYQDAATFAGCDHEAPNGSCFFVVALSDRHEFPQLAGTFGVQLTPTARLVLHDTRESYINAILAAQTV